MAILGVNKTKLHWTLDDQAHYINVLNNLSQKNKKKIGSLIIHIFLSFLKKLFRVLQ